VFVNGFDGSMGERDLMNEIDNWNLGHCEKRIPKDRQSNCLKGFMFLEFQNNNEAMRAIDIIMGKRLQGKRLRARFAEDKK